MTREQEKERDMFVLQCGGSIPIQHADRPKEKKQIEFSTVLFYAAIVAIIVMLIYAICGNVAFVRAQDHTLKNDVWCAIARIGI